MKLLIVTQKVDRTDPILGFFHRWLEQFAKQCESIIVIGQSVGEYDLPSNVTVESIGKEKGRSKFMQIFRYHRLLWTHRKEFDAILVHMTPIWVVLALPCSLFFSTRWYLWYEARGTRWPLKVALMLVKKVFSASSAGMPIATSKSVITGHGIDTERYQPGSEARDMHQLITVGRITESKRLPIILRTLHELSPEHHLSIIGKTLTSADAKTELTLRALITTLELKDRVDWKTVPPAQMPPVLQHAGLFLHASVTSLDKALLEAMACGCLVLSCSDAARGVLPSECVTTADGMPFRAKEILTLSSDQQNALRARLRDIVVQKHSLPRLIERLLVEMR